MKVETGDGLEKMIMLGKGKIRSKRLLEWHDKSRQKAFIKLLPESTQLNGSKHSKLQMFISMVWIFSWVIKIWLEH